MSLEGLSIYCWQRDEYVNPCASASYEISCCRECCCETEWRICCALSITLARYCKVDVSPVVKSIVTVIETVIAREAERAVSVPKPLLGN